MRKTIRRAGAGLTLSVEGFPAQVWSRADRRTGRTNFYPHIPRGCDVVWVVVQRPEGNRWANAIIDNYGRLLYVRMYND